MMRVMTDQSAQIRDAAAAAMRGEQAARGYSNEDLARLSGIPLRTLVTYLDGSADIKLPRFVQIATALAVTPQELMALTMRRLREQERRSGNRDASWHSELAEVFRRAYSRQPHLSPADILPRRPHLVQRAIDGDPTLDDATLTLIAQGLGLDPGIVQSIKVTDRGVSEPRSTDARRAQSL